MDVNEVERAVRKRECFRIGDGHLESEAEARRPNSGAPCGAGRDVRAQDSGASRYQEFRIEPRAATDRQNRRTGQFVGDQADATPELLAEQPRMERGRAARTKDLVFGVDAGIEEVGLRPLVIVMV